MSELNRYARLADMLGKAADPRPIANPFSPRLSAPRFGVPSLRDLALPEHSAALVRPSSRPRRFAVATPKLRGIRFKDTKFSEPRPFDRSWLPMWPGIYAIMVLDGRCTPRPYRAIYFGKAAVLSSRVDHSHENFDKWRHAACGATLYVAYHPMVGTHDRERATLEKALIEYYAPECNDRLNPLSNPFFG